MHVLEDSTIALTEIICAVHELLQMVVPPGTGCAWLLTSRVAVSETFCVLAFAVAARIQQRE